MRDRAFQRRNHGKVLKRRAHSIECRLLLIRVGIAPACGESRNRPRIHVPGRGDTARAASAQGCEEKRLTSGEHVEAAWLKTLEHRPRIVPVAGAVLDAGDGAGVGVDQPLDEPKADARLRYTWNVRQVDAQTLIADALNHFCV